MIKDNDQESNQILGEKSRIAKGNSSNYKK